MQNAREEGEKNKRLRPIANVDDSDSTWKSEPRCATRHHY